MHANLVNLSPLDQQSPVDLFKKAYSKELRHFVNVLKGEKENRSSAGDALKVMNIIDALYESAARGEEVDISSL